MKYKTDIEFIEPAPDTRSTCGLSPLEIEQAADEVIQIVVEKMAQAEIDCNEVLFAAIALVEALDRTRYIKSWMVCELERLRAAIVGLGEVAR